MDAVLEEIKTLRGDVKARIGQGLQEISVAAERISPEVIRAFGAFHAQVRNCQYIMILLFILQLHGS